MNEKYKFSETKKPIEQLDFSDGEIKTINNVGLSVKDLQKLVDGEPFAEGSYALIFELPENDSKMLAKVWKNPESDSTRSQCEYVALRLLRLHNSTEVPRVSGYLKNASILFEEKIEGNPIDSLDKNIIKQIAKTISKIHSITLNSYGKPLTKRKKGSKMDYFNDEVEKLYNSLSLLPNSASESPLIKDSINKIKAESNQNVDAFNGNDFTLIHFDLNRNNILKSTDSDEIIIIDWEQASAGDSAMDIAKLFLKLNFTDEQKKDFLYEYEKNMSRADSGFRDRLHVYEYLVLINSILWRLNVLDNEPEKKLSTNEYEFYNRVRNNLTNELDIAQKFLNNKE